MERTSNGGMLYHEVQEANLCAVHCVNTVLQGPFFSEFDLAAVASDLDEKERQVMLEGAAAADFFSEESHNVSLGGDFSIQVQLRLRMTFASLNYSLGLAEGFGSVGFTSDSTQLSRCRACADHWFCIRKVSGEWYNFDSLLAAPQHLSKFYLSAFLDSLKGSGWSIFIVKGNFPRECPMSSSSEASNGFGQWLCPEDAERILKETSSTQSSSSSSAVNNRSSDNVDQQRPYQALSREEVRTFSEMEDDDLKAAIAASLLDASAAGANLGAVGITSQREDTEKQKLLIVLLKWVLLWKSCSTDRGLVHESLGGGNVSDVMLWRKKNMSVGIVTVTIGSWMVFETFSYTILTLQVFFSSCSLVSSSGPNLHLSSTVLLGSRPSPPPFPEFHITEAMAKEASKLLRIHLNKLFQVSHDIAMGRDSELFIKVAISLFLISFIGSLMDFQTLCHTVPTFYERYEVYIDISLLLIYNRAKELYLRFQIWAHPENEKLS
ncbi:hypothetical protein HID58_014320 [Brassica napus]|uniref:Reticulon-like protein n=1 Tax=Brassica napus TaxID=3708 RepID=A0ABQ8DHE3_BRANA|nr:hypothetical protein HID58_014320 [Brassica napus]